MQRYKNLNGDSNISSFELGNDSITIQFKEGSIYVYTYESAGMSNVETMKQFAQSGSGLNSFIMRNARNLYARKTKI
ncbi:MAG: hypothetical protein M0P13_09695 [Fibrobacteraceae bacterium]|nr:hypothetical protein [Fibrobacteraceae bacterium]